MTHHSSVLAVLVALVAVAAIVSSASAAVFPPNVANDVYGVQQGGGVNGIPTAALTSDAGPNIKDAINLLEGTGYPTNAACDPLYVDQSSVWTELNGGFVLLIGLSAGASNTLGVYTDLGVGSNRTNLLGPFSGFGFVGTGTQADPFTVAATTGLPSGTPFGWFLNSVYNGVHDWYSEGDLNANGYRHMMAFDLAGAGGSTIYIDSGSGATPVTLQHPYLMAWEDLPWDGQSLGDEDFNDMMYIFDRVAPTDIPECASVVIWSVLTMIGVIAVRRRR